MPMLYADMFGRLNPIRMSGSNNYSNSPAKVLLIKGHDILALQKFFYRE
jgi:hypothetical protein